MRLIAMLAAMAYAPLVVADLNEQIAACKAVENDIARLGCFDQIEVASSLPPPRRNQLERDQYVVKEDVNPIDDSRDIAVIVYTEESLGKAPALVFRCSSGRFGMSISWDEYLGSDPFVPLTIRLGDDQPVKTKWHNSTSHRATIVSDQNDEWLAQRLMNYTKFAAQVRTSRGALKTAVWDLDGLAEVLGPIREECM